MPADLQVGEYRAAVHTTKIMLALNGVSKQQSQPFMVRVEINIAESKAWGGQGASQPQERNTFMGAGLYGLAQVDAGWLFILSVQTLPIKLLSYKFSLLCSSYTFINIWASRHIFMIVSIIIIIIIVNTHWHSKMFAVGYLYQEISWPTVYRMLFDQQLLSCFFNHNTVSCDSH